MALEGSAGRQAILLLYRLQTCSLLMGALAPFPRPFAGQDALETVPTLLIVNVCFSVVYNQMAGPFQSQACQMNTWVGSVQLNAAFFNIADCIAIIVFVPILEKIVYPLIGRMKGSPVTLKQKLVAGLAVAGFSMIVAAGLEYLRRSLPVVQPKGTVPNMDCCLYGV
jgi:dipeptide/tripeptide permease